MKKKPTTISLMCGGDLARIVSVELRPERSVRTTIEITAKADVIEQLEAGQYVNAEREVWRRVHAAWQAEDNACRAVYDADCERLRREHRDRCRLADQDGLPHPQEPKMPVYDGPEPPVPVKSSRSVLDMAAGRLDAVLSLPRYGGGEGEAGEIVHVAGEVKSAPKLVVEGWEVSLVVKVDHRPTDETVLQLRRAIGDTAHIYATQRDIEEAIKETSGVAPGETPADRMLALIEGFIAEHAPDLLDRWNRLGHDNRLRRARQVGALISAGMPTVEIVNVLRHGDPDGVDTTQTAQP